MQQEKARICEREFLELCTRIFSYKNNPTDIQKFLGTVRTFIDFDTRIISDLAKEIFHLKYKPHKKEIAKVMADRGYSLSEIGKAFGKSKAAMCHWVQDDLPLFPRCTEEQQREVIRFMEQYNKLFTTNLINLI